MAQITIYLDDNTAALVKAAVKEAGSSGAVILSAL